MFKMFHITNTAQQPPLQLDRVAAELNRKHSQWPRNLHLRAWLVRERWLLKLIAR